VALPAGSYEIGTSGGTILKANVTIENGKVNVMDLSRSWKKLNRKDTFH